MCLHLNVCSSLFPAALFHYKDTLSVPQSYCERVRPTHACAHLSVLAEVIMCKLRECMCVVRQGEGGIFFKYRGVDNYGLNECSQSASLSVCKKKKAQLKPLQGRLITLRKRGNINGRFCGYNVTAKWLHRPRHERRSRLPLKAPCRPVQMYVRVLHFCR